MPGGVGLRDNYLATLFALVLSSKDLCDGVSGYIVLIQKSSLEVENASNNFFGNSTSSCSYYFSCLFYLAGSAQQVNEDCRIGTFLIRHFLAVIFCNYEHVCRLLSAHPCLVKMAGIIANPCSSHERQSHSDKCLEFTVNDCLA